MNPTVFRVARPTDKLAEIRKFYIDALGLSEIGSFTDHDGYDGLMVGIPGKEYHLEFTTHVDGSPCPSPTNDNLLVFYFSDQSSVEEIRERFNSQGQKPVEPENSYWVGRSLTFEDPDGWRVVLCNLSADD